MNLFFIQQECKHNELAFLTFRNVSEHVFLSLVPIVQPGMP